MGEGKSVGWRVPDMKKTWILLGTLGALSIGGGFAQQAKDPFGSDSATVEAAPGAEQTPDPFGSAAAGADPFGGRPRPENIKFDFSFPGGSLKEFSNLIEHSNNALRIIVPEVFADAPVPSMHFKGVTFSDLSELVTAVTRRTDSQVTLDHVGHGRWVAQASVRKPERELAIFPATALIKGRTVDDLMAVIEQAFLVAGKQPLPQFHLHQETMVLMASLTKSEAEIVKRLFEVLERPAVDGKADLRDKRDTVIVELDQLRERLTERNTAFLKLQKSAGAAQKDPAEAIRLEVRVRMMRNEIALIESEIMGYMELLNRLRARELGLADDLAPAPAAEVDRDNPFDL